MIFYLISLLILFILYKVFYTFFQLQSYKLKHKNRATYYFYPLLGLLKYFMEGNKHPTKDAYYKITEKLHSGKDV